MARRLAEIALDYILGAPLDTLGASLQLTEPLPRVAHAFGGELLRRSFRILIRRAKIGNTETLLSCWREELRQQFAKRLPVPVIDPGQGIRATVIGASQYTVQVSGKTIYLPDPGVLPVHGVPVVRVGLDLVGRHRS